MDKDTERMKIEIVAGYITTIYTNTLVVLVTVFLVVFAAFLAAFLAKQIEIEPFGIAIVIVEIVVVLMIMWQRQKFDRRMDYLDNLIRNLEGSMAGELGSLTTILAKVRDL
jgi:hypothetical protein